MLDFFFDIPLLLAAVIIIGSLCLFAMLGLLYVRRRVIPRLRITTSDSEFSGSMLQAVLVFYGLAVALMAVNVLQSYNDVSKIVSGEVTAVNMIYRDVTSYPEPIRTQLQDQLRLYVQDIIQVAWPMQANGEVPVNGIRIMTEFQVILTSFEPTTEGQKLLHGEALRAYNNLIEARRLRLDSVGTQLPGIMWTVIIMGAFIGLTTSFFFKVEDSKLHSIQVLLLAIFIGLVIFMIVALDQPFRGDLGLTAEPYQLLYDQLMKVK